MTTTPDKESAFQLGQDALDREHQGQIDLLLAIEAELGGAGDRARLDALLDQLIEYTNIHFMSEQVEMRQQVYPELPAHEAEHDQLMEQMRDFQKRIEWTDKPSAPPTFQPCATGCCVTSDPRTPPSPNISSITPRAEASERSGILATRRCISLATRSPATRASVR